MSALIPPPPAYPFQNRLNFLLIYGITDPYLKAGAIGGVFLGNVGGIQVQSRRS